jgi:hypothetical protein
VRLTFRQKRDKQFAAFAAATGYTKAQYLALTLRERHYIIEALERAAKGR